MNDELTRILTVANEAADNECFCVAASLVTITEEPSPAGRIWRIHYGPRDYISRRGGDLNVLVEERTASVQRIIRGQ
jgi:hypothetical protein